MGRAEILKRLKDGQVLTNFGVGWFIGKPHVPYKTQVRTRVPGETINTMMVDGIIKLRHHTRSMSAVLT